MSKTKEEIILIARERILKGDFLVFLWERYCRKVKKGWIWKIKKKDKSPIGFASSNARKGEKVKIVRL